MILKRFALIGVLASVGFIGSVFAESVATVPEGYVTVTIAPGTGTARTLSVVAIPLLESSQELQGASAGRITSVTANTISSSLANWVPGELSVASSPHLITITSGAAVGRRLLISTATPNTATTLTIDAEEAAQVDLTTLGIVTGASDGDTFTITRCDTLRSIFGTPADTGVLGASSSASADIVQVQVAGGWRQYYFSTSGSGNWRRVGPNTVSDNVAIRPDTPVLFSRLGDTPITLLAMGTVPSTQRVATIRNSGLTTLSAGWPVELTLGTSNISSIPGWVSNPSSSLADTVQLQVAGGWRQYYHDGTNWRRIGSNTVSNGVVIPPTSGILINKRGSESGVTTLTQNIPYSLEVE